MDKSQDAIAPPNTTLNEPPPPFPGVGTSSQFSGGFQAPPDSGLVTGKKENNILNIMVIKYLFQQISVGYQNIRGFLFTFIRSKSSSAYSDSNLSTTSARNRSSDSTVSSASRFSCFLWSTCSASDRNIDSYKLWKRANEYYKNLTFLHFQR